MSSGDTYPEPEPVAPIYAKISLNCLSTAITVLIANEMYESLCGVSPHTRITSSETSSVSDDL